MNSLSLEDLENPEDLALILKEILKKRRKDRSEEVNKSIEATAIAFLKIVEASIGI